MQNINNTFLENLQSTISDPKMLCTLGAGIVIGLGGRVISRLLQKCFPTMQKINHVQEDRMHFKTSNWDSTPHHIQNQVIARIPQSIKQMPTFDTLKKSTIVTLKYNKELEKHELMGYVISKNINPMNLSCPPTVNRERISAPIIELLPPYKDKGFLYVLFANVCDKYTKQGDAIYLQDLTLKGEAAELCTNLSFLTRFDVYYAFSNNPRGTYLLTQKTKATNTLNYLKLPNDVHGTRIIDPSSPEKLEHLINYLDSYPEDLPRIKTMLTENDYFDLGVNNPYLTTNVSFLPLDQGRQYEAHYNKLRLACEAGVWPPHNNLEQKQM